MSSPSRKRGPRGEDIDATPQPINRAMVLSDEAHCVFRGERNNPGEASLVIYRISEEGYEAVCLTNLPGLARLHDFLGECLIQLQSGMN